MTQAMLEETLAKVKDVLALPLLKQVEDEDDASFMSSGEDIQDSDSCPLEDTHSLTHSIFHTFTSSFFVSLARSA